MPERTSSLFNILANEHNMDRWVLVGGTALALYLRHRTSEDLDFFIEEKVLGRGSLREIDAIIEGLEQEGVPVVLIEEEDYLRDYEIAGVKVTFIASSIKPLRNDIVKIGSVNIASVDTIAAMKIESIVKYRTVTRDFFDIYSLWKLQNRDLFSLIDNHRAFYLKSISPELLERRLFFTPPDGSDPGFAELSVINAKEIQQIRLELQEWLNTTTREEDRLLVEMIQDSSFANEDQLFGIRRMSLPQKLQTYGVDDLVQELLKEYAFDLTYESLDGKNLLDYYEDSFAKQESIVFPVLRSVPDEWLNSKRYAFSERLLERLRLENSIIAQIENKDDEIKLARIAEKKGWDREDYIQKVREKASFVALTLSKSTS